MQEAAKKAGMANLDVALEPEAASLYCSINKDIDQNFFKKGEYYIVCDLGGGTGDIVAHLVGTNNHLNEIYPSCGGNYGSNEIDKLIFEEIIFSLFKCKDFNGFYSKYKRKNKDNIEEGGILYNDWSELEREIRDFKEGGTNKKVENNEKYPINCSLFKDIFPDDIDISDIVYEYNINIFDKDLHLNVIKSKRKWIIEFPYKILYNYIKAQANSICKIIKEILSKENIKTVIFVGGYCFCEILLKLIKEGLPQISHYLQPTKPCLSIMEGAVIFGIEPSSINIRKAKYTMGADLRVPWNQKLHTQICKKFSTEDNSYYCNEYFEKFIEINENIELDKKIVRKYLMVGKRFCNMKFYITKKKDPIHIFEEGLEEIGECCLDAGKDYENKDDREIEVTITFGGTYFDVRAIHIKSGNFITKKLNYNKFN